MDTKSLQLHSPQEAWQIVLGLLEAEMPRASFDTWVRDTQVLSFENNIFSVGAHNAYARDWLESRLSSTVRRMLVGIYNAEVEVKFEEMPESEGELEDPKEVDDKETGFTAEPLDITRYRHEVHPDHIVMLDAYCLRLMEQGDMTAKELSLWVGFRQAVWRQWKIGQGTVRNIPHWQVMEFAMMSRASYFRELSGKTLLAGGHVELVPEPLNAKSRNADRRLDNANRYRVWMSPRLTRHDGAVLEMILRDRGNTATKQNEAYQSVLAALQDLAERDVIEWINQEAEIGTASPHSVQEIVQRVLGVQGDLSEDVQIACEKVYDRILSAFGKVSITHYFLRVVVPTMQFTQAQAWAIIVLRDRCWFDHESQTQKEFAIVRGGLETLARWVGSSLKSVTRWLDELEFSAFVRLADMEKLEVPTEWVASGTKVFLIHQQEPLLGELFGGRNLWTKRDSALDKMRLYPGQSETLLQTKRDSILDKMRLYLGQSETRLNSLIKPYLNLNKPQQTTTRSETPDTDESEESVVAVNFRSWDLDRIFQINRVHPKIRKELAGADPRRLVSWLIYAVSQEGRGIERPLSYALDQLSLCADEGAGGEYDTFANLPPAEQIDLILGRTWDNNWENIMGHESRRPRMLLPILLGEDAPKETRFVERIITKTHIQYPADF